MRKMINFFQYFLMKLVKIKLFSLISNFDAPARIIYSVMKPKIDIPTAKISPSLSMTSTMPK